MVPILADLRARLLERRIERLEANVAFERELAPIATRAAILRAERTLENASLRAASILIRPAIAAGAPNPEAERAKTEELARLEERYVWKRRANAQSERRFAARHPGACNTRYREAAAKLELLRSEEAAMIERRYAPSADASGRERYDRVSAAVTARTAARAAVVETAKSRRIAAIEARSQHAVAKGNARLDVLRMRLDEMRPEAVVPDRSLLPDEMLLLDDLSMHFGGLKAVDGLSFSVKRGEIFGLIGPNGAGKTTVFNCITRFYRPTRGTVWFRDRKDMPVDLGGYAVHDVIRLGLVRTFQNVELIWELPVLENLLLAAHTLYGTGFFGQLFNVPRLRAEESVMREKARRILADLDLSAYERMPVLGLPYGILKKIELARTLMVNPRLIILDEPAAGLNDAETEALARTIRKIRDDYDSTILLVEHDMGLVMAICDRIAAISFGKLLAVGTPAEIQASPVVREAYLGGE